MELRSTGNYFRGTGEQAHSFGDLGTPANKEKNKFKSSHLKGKALILFDLKNIYFGLVGVCDFCPQTPLIQCHCIYFPLSTHIWIYCSEKHGEQFFRCSFVIFKIVDFYG